MSTPPKVSNRQIRKAVNNQAAVVEAHRETLRALVNDELKTRGRVDALEKLFDDLGRVAGEAHAMATPRPTLWGRLRWLLTGH